MRRIGYGSLVSLVTQPWQDARFVVKNVDVGNMGEPALKSYMSRLRQRASQRLPQHPQRSAQPAAAIDGKDILAAQVLWVFKCVSSHYSYTSSSGIGELFERIFPDSSIAKSIGMSELKCAYLCRFGISLWIVDCLRKKIRPEPSCFFFFF